MAGAEDASGVKLKIAAEYVGEDRRKVDSGVPESFETGHNFAMRCGFEQKGSCFAPQ